MVSSIIRSPASGATLRRNQDNTVTVRTTNLQTGFFSDPNAQYYAIPQQLNGQGVIQGHQHVTVQRIGALDATSFQPPNAQVFQFFKGLNDAANGRGDLSVVIPAGTLTETGTYRVCTMSGAFGHQPLVMPVAQRGAQDDCVRVRVE
ncbi:hypothetical protein BC832DRAFT_554378 [Gaertneriomyces semiglobifer]|nr:hypothetical protein BC832DRAFT_554378 [Gaertneriomyces semiglobifer]